MQIIFIRPLHEEASFKSQPCSIMPGPSKPFDPRLQFNDDESQEEGCFVSHGVLIGILYVNNQENALLNVDIPTFFLI